MKLFVGLGNPGPKHARNRHNVGFMAVDRISERHGFGKWSRKFQGSVAAGRIGDIRVALLKPETFMNNSGQSVGEAARYYRVDQADIVVFHDELDLAPGRCRFKSGGGHAGHNGLRSVHRHVGDDYCRVRIGIGHPGQRHLVTPFVLGNFAKADADWLDGVLDGIADGAAHLAAGDGSGFMNKAARRRTDHARPLPRAASRKGADGKHPAPDDAPPPEPERDGSLLVRLFNHFRR